jgi:hypothetical protein
MTSVGKTSKVINYENKILGLEPYIYRSRKMNTNLTGSTPSDKYQKLKIIQNTVRVDASLYTANLGPLASYSRPNNSTYGVCWNQMSDSVVPSVQKSTVPTGFHNSLKTRRHSVTSSRPGCQTPGGLGCDIKHNSYDRYLNRLKGKGPLRKGVIPSNFGNPINFSISSPIYGGKITKTSIVNGCECPIVNENVFKLETPLYNNPNYFEDPISIYTFYVGSYVYAIKNGDHFYSQAVITSINGNTYTIQFYNGDTQNVQLNDLQINLHPCKS